MALLDIVNVSTDASVVELNRTSMGVLIDITDNIGSIIDLSLTIPDEGNVINGVDYGQQGTGKTGTYICPVIPPLPSGTRSYTFS